MENEKRAQTIISMMNEALDSNNEKLYWQAQGYVEGMRRSGEFSDDFAALLQRYIREEWREKRRKCRKWFGKIWRLTA